MANCAIFKQKNNPFFRKNSVPLKPPAAPQTRWIFASLVSLESYINNLKSAKLWAFYMQVLGVKFADLSPKSDLWSKFM